MKRHPRPNHLRRALSVPAAAALAVALLGPCTTAHAQLTFTPTFDSTITSDPNGAAIQAVINQALLIYQSTFTNPINVKITFGEMTSGLGQSSTFFFNNIGYGAFRTALVAGATSADDLSSLVSVPNTVNNPLTGTPTINVKTANAHALGLGLGYTGTDSTITLNTHLTDVGSAGTTGQYSLRVVTQHEVDEALGLGSSLAGIPANNPFPEDLFRYSSLGTRSFSTATSPQPYLSFDGGLTSAVQYNTNGGGDYGDYNGVGGPRVQDAFATVGATPVLGVELRALDVIGYTRSAVSPVPEPGVLTLGSITAVAFAFGVWRKSRGAGRASA